MQTQCKKCFALPFADIMIIAHLYSLCLVFAEEQGSAMPEMVPVHTERHPGPGPSRHPAIHPQASAAGLLYGNLQSFTSLVSPGKRHCWLLSLGTACCLLELSHVQREPQVPPCPWVALPVLPCCNHPGCWAGPSSAAPGASSVTDVHWGFCFSLGNLMRHMVFKVQVINRVT